MLNDEEINEILKLDTNDENFFLCFICLDLLNKIGQKKYYKDDEEEDNEIKKILILNSIFEKNIKKNSDEYLKKILEKEKSDLISLKGINEFKKLYKIEKEEIQTYLKNINEEIQKIQELKKTKEKEEKNKIESKKVIKNITEKLGNDNLSF